LALNSAVERTQPFAPELSAAKSLGAKPDIVSPLERFAVSGVPDAATLSRELLALLPSLRAAAAPAHGGFFTKLQANAERLVRIRPEHEQEGNQIAAILDRIEVKAAHADISGVVAGLEDLPPAVRSPANTWIEKAQARAAALKASQELLATSLTGLGR
jgi:hypothetical protein